MIDTMYFFASNKDLCNIFGAIEKEFDIKYCACYVYAENGEKPDIEFNTIEEIVDSYGEIYYIVQKTQTMQTDSHILEGEKRVRYVTRCDNNTCLTFRTAKNPNGYEGDYEVHIPREYETEFMGALFKRIVREVKRNCVKIKYISPFYVGQEMYKNIGDYIFLSQRSLFPLIVTETNEAKRWWKNPNVRKFMDKPIIEQLPFLQDVFSQKRLQNFGLNNIQRKDWTEDDEIYEGIMYKLRQNRNLSLLKDVATLFDDGVRVKEPFYMIQTAMEELRNIEIEWAFSQKADGIRILLENLKNVPSIGYHCGNKEVIKTLFKKKYYETFKESLLNVTDETKEIIRNTVEDISDKRLQKQVNEVIGLLKLSIQRKW